MIEVSTNEVISGTSNVPRVITRLTKVDKENVFSIAKSLLQNKDLPLIKAMAAFQANKTNSDKLEAITAYLIDECIEDNVPLPIFMEGAYVTKHGVFGYFGLGAIKKYCHECARLKMPMPSKCEFKYILKSPSTTVRAQKYLELAMVGASKADIKAMIMEEVKPPYQNVLIKYMDKVNNESHVGRVSTRSIVYHEALADKGSICVRKSAHDFAGASGKIYMMLVDGENNGSITEEYEHTYLINEEATVCMYGDNLSIFGKNQLQMIKTKFYRTALSEYLLLRHPGYEQAYLRYDEDDVQIIEVSAKKDDIRAEKIANMARE